MSKIPRIFEGKTVYILASGPSLHELDGRDWLRGRSCLAVNSSLFVGDYSQVLFFGDAKWYWWNQQAVDQFKGLKFTLDLKRKNGLDKTVANQPDVIVLKQSRKDGLELKGNRVSFNGSSGSCALNLAYLLGAARLVLLGFDMRIIDGERNYIQHPIRGSDKYWKLVNRFKVLADCLKKAEVEVINATEGSALPWFPRMHLKEVLRLFPE